MYKVRVYLHGSLVRLSKCFQKLVSIGHRMGKVVSIAVSVIYHIKYNGCHAETLKRAALKWINFRSDIVYLSMRVISKRNGLRSFHRFSYVYRKKDFYTGCYCKQFIIFRFTKQIELNHVLYFTKKN